MSRTVRGAVGLPVLANARGAAVELADDPGVTLVKDDRIKSWVEALWSMSWERTDPVPGTTLLASTEGVLAIYSEVWEKRRARRA